MPETLLRLRDVESRTGLRRSHLYGLAQRGEFPKPLKLGNRASAWVAGEVDAWINARIRASGRSIALENKGSLLP
jgi:prophage regulatory protein